MAFCWVCILKENKDTPISHCQCDGCWWPGDGRSQGISSHDIDFIYMEYSIAHMERVNEIVHGIV